MPIIQGDISGMNLEETERAITTLQGYRSYLQMFGTDAEIAELDKEALQLEEQRKLLSGETQPVGAAVGSAESNTDNDPNAGSKTTSSKSKS